MKWIAKSLIESALASLPGTEGAIRRVLKPGRLRMREQQTARLAPRFRGIDLYKLAVGQSHIIARKRAPIP
jgi:hypothetical protein